VKIRLITGPVEQVALVGEWGTKGAALTGVEWSREAALLVDMGECPTAGYDVHIRSIHLPAPDQIDLTLQVRRPKPGEITAQMITHPWTFRRLPKAGLHDGPVLVVARDEAGKEILRQVVSPCER
jgi:hypothetical protein